MEDYEGELEQGVPEPSPPPPGGELLDSVVRPALVAGAPRGRGGGGGPRAGAGKKKRTPPTQNEIDLCVVGSDLFILDRCRVAATCAGRTTDS
jgi:hypothetical protein